MPIDTKKLDDFDPLGVPTVTELLAEIDSWDSLVNKSRETSEDKKEMDIRPVLDYEKTSLKPYVEFFKSHVASMLRQERGVKQEREDDENAMEF